MSLTDGLRGYWGLEIGPTASPQSVICVCVCVCVCVCLCAHARTHIRTQSCPTLCDPIDDNPPGSSVHGILQARILEWVAISSSRASSQCRDRT